MLIRKIRKLLVPLPVLLFCHAAHAGLEGDYDLISGPGGCPTGAVQFIVDEEKESRTLLFGGRHNWPMNMKNRSVVKDVVKGGCTYVWASEMSKNKFSCKTTSSKCPSAAHNGVVTETMHLQGKTMTYEFGSKDEQFKCQYKKLPDS